MWYISYIICCCLVFCLYVLLNNIPRGQLTDTCPGASEIITDGKRTIIGSDNGLSPCRRQAIIWTNGGILLIWPQGRKFNQMLSEILIFSFKKMYLKMSSAKCLAFCPGLIVPWWRHQMETFSALLAFCAGNSPHKGQWHGALMFSLICVWINGWVNTSEAGDFRRNRAHYDVIVMTCVNQTTTKREPFGSVPSHYLSQWWVMSNWTICKKTLIYDSHRRQFCHQNIRLNTNSVYLAKLRYRNYLDTITGTL